MLLTCAAWEVNIFSLPWREEEKKNIIAVWQTRTLPRDKKETCKQRRPEVDAAKKLSRVLFIFSLFVPLPPSLPPAPPIPWLATFQRSIGQPLQPPKVNSFGILFGFYFFSLFFRGGALRDLLSFIVYFHPWPSAFIAKKMALLNFNFSIFFYFCLFLLVLLFTSSFISYLPFLFFALFTSYFLSSLFTFLTLLTFAFSFIYYFYSFAVYSLYDSNNVFSFWIYLLQFSIILRRFPFQFRYSWHFPPFSFLFGRRYIFLFLWSPFRQLWYCSSFQQFLHISLSFPSY